MKLDDVRAFALSLPDVTEEPHFEKTSFRVRGKIFATVPPGGDYVHVILDEFDARALAVQGNAGVEELMWGKRTMGVRLKLGVVEGDLVYDLLEESWRRWSHRRPK